MDMAKPKYESEKQKSLYMIASLVFIVIIFAAVIYFGLGKPSITGEVTLDKGEFNMITPFGFSFIMLLIGVMAAIFVIFMISRESVER